MYCIAVKVESYLSWSKEPPTSAEEKRPTVVDTPKSSPGLRGASLKDNDTQMIKYFGERGTDIRVIYGYAQNFRCKGLFESIFYGGLPTQAKRSNTVCVVGTPPYMPIPDFIHLLQEREMSVETLQVIRDPRRANTVIVLNFKTQDEADAFFTEFNGKPFQTLCEEACNLLFVQDVTLSDDMQKAPPADSVEIPSCLVCLDRMEPSHTGIIDTISDHLISSLQSSDWLDQNCEVCRAISIEAIHHKCHQCGGSEDLWICVICGHIGCGRYQEGHSMKHHEATLHNYTIELVSQRIWDYIGDGYVHRIALSRSDCKSKEFSDSRHPKSSLNRLAHVDQSKVEEITLEYNHLLISQLDAQRAWFEEQLNLMKTSHEEKMTTLLNELSEAKQGLERAKEKIEKEKKSQEKKVLQVQEKYQKELSELESLKQVYSSSVVTQRQWQERCAAMEMKIKESNIRMDAMIGDLEEQIRDLQFTIETQKKVGRNIDLAGGQVSIVMSDRPSPAKRKGRKKGG